MYPNSPKGTQTVFMSGRGQGLSSRLGFTKQNFCPEFPSIPAVISE